MSADVASISKSVSSFRIVPFAVAGSACALSDGFDNVTVNVSSSSTSLSPLTGTLIVFDVSPISKANVPVGNDPPKSAPSTSAPVTPQPTVVVPLVSPVRVTVNVKSWLPASPSSLSASTVAVMLRSMSSFSMVPVPVAVSPPPANVTSFPPAWMFDSTTVNVSSVSTS